MKRIAIALLSLGMLCAPLARSGYEEGRDAYQTGDFVTALKELLPSAKQGHASAQYKLGFMYEEGEGVRQDAAEAVKWYRKAADQGLRVAQFSLGRMYAYGKGVRQDAAEAVKWYRKAADQGYDHAQYTLGLMYEAGKGTNQDSVEAVKWYRRAAEQDHAAAQLSLALMTQAGIGAQQITIETVKKYRKAAEQGDSKAQLYLGLMYEAGEGVRQNASEAVKFYRKAAEQGHAEAQFKIGNRYNHDGVFRPPSAEEVKWLRKAADQGHAKAQYYLGNLYANGQGVRQDDAEAVKWYRKSAEQGHAYAQFYLGTRYDEGNGVQQDAGEAVKWYRKAAGQGYLRAQYYLGGMYKAGKGVSQDVGEAINWYRMASTNPANDVYFKHQAQKQLDALLAAIPTRSAVSYQPQQPTFTDHEPPSLSLDHSNTQTITQGDLVIQGLATDPSGIAEVTVEGKAIAFAANGAFNLKRYFPLGTTVLEIAAIDVHGNRATQQLTVIRQAAATQIAADEPALTPPPAKTRSNPNALALIVGVEDYRNAPQARWAAQDAFMFYDYAQRSLGIPAGNIKLLTGEQANRTGMLAALKNWLAPMITPGKSQVYVYFAGHGLAASEGDKAYLIPQDGDPSLLEDTALDRQRLFDEIAKVKPKSTTVFLDTCYSGGARGGDGTLVANARPVLIKSKAATLPPGFMQFSAASGDQLAHSHPSQQHGLFSYYLMRGLSGEADANQDNKLTAGELQDYVQTKVKRMALTQGRPQEPELIGDRDRVIAVWNK
jgi:hypothetical protein